MIIKWDSNRKILEHYICKKTRNNNTKMLCIVCSNETECIFGDIFACSCSDFDGNDESCKLTSVVFSKSNVYICPICKDYSDIDNQDYFLVFRERDEK